MILSFPARPPGLVQKLLIDDSLLTTHKALECIHLASILLVFPDPAMKVLDSQVPFMNHNFHVSEKDNLGKEVSFQSFFQQFFL